MFIKRLTYDTMLDTISEQQHKIEKLQQENIEANLRIIKLTRRCNSLALDLTTLRNMFLGRGPNIDFPNSNEKGGNGVNTTMTDTNGNISF